VIEWSELKDLHHSCHEEDQPEHEACEQDGPRSIHTGIWFCHFLLTHIVSPPNADSERAPQSLIC